MRFFEEINFTLRKLYKKLPCWAKFISFVSASFSSVIKRQFRSRKRQVRTNLVDNFKTNLANNCCLAFYLAFLFLLLLFAELNRHQNNAKTMRTFVEMKPWRVLWPIGIFSGQNKHANLFAKETGSEQKALLPTHNRITPSFSTLVSTRCTIITHSIKAKSKRLIERQQYRQGKKR